MINLPNPKCGHPHCAPHHCRFANTEPAPVKEVRYPDFRDYPTYSNPDHDLDTFGRPLKPGT